MIREWRLCHFKSVKAQTTVQLAPLTVLTGPNSSGKSSLIQSILLVNQTLSSKVARRQIILNGDLVKLGTYADVLSDGTTDKQISVGFSIETDLGDSRRRRRWGGTPYLSPRRYRQIKNAVAEFDVDLAFRPIETPDDAARPKPTFLQAELERGSFNTSIRPKQETIDPTFFHDSQRLEVQRRERQAVASILQAAENADMYAKGDDQSLRYEVLTPIHESQLASPHAQSTIDDTEIVAAQLDHFLPSALTTRFSTAKRSLQEALSDLIEQSYVRSTDEEFVCPPDPIYAELVSVLQSRALQAQVSVGDYLRSYRSTARRVSRAEIEPDVKGVIDVAFANLPVSIRAAKSLDVIPAPEFMQMLNSAVSQEFTLMRYLGPLRDDPKPVYSIASSADPSHVGYKGECTAAVLDLYADQYVSFMPPGRQDSHEYMPLSDAVQMWLAHFDIADSYTTTEEGKLGHRLYIRPTGINRSLDLTNVGVGVSQVLPILVMALVSDPGSILIFEQPELHLHPKVQSLLADFFIAVSRSGRQCIIETHSEYLVNRLRLRVAESPWGSRLNEEVALYFVQRDGGESRFNRIHIDDFGAISDWPDGFFDQGPAESERILAAALRKQRQAKPKRHDG